jgi:uncharacterized protein
MFDNIAATNDENPCLACGACCSYSSDWPRFSTESDEVIELIPPQLVNACLSGMRCDGDRCAALSGEIGVATSCTVYALRPEVCRTCMPGDAECTMARNKFGLPALIEPAYAVAASTSSSSSSSIGTKLASGLVESVIGLRLPVVAGDGVRAGGASRESA